MDGQYTPRKHDGFAANLGRKTLDERKRETDSTGNHGIIELHHYYMKTLNGDGQPEWDEL